MVTESENIRFISVGSFICDCTLNKRPKCNKICGDAEKSTICIFERRADRAILPLIEDGVYARSSGKHLGEPREETDKAIAAIEARKVS